MSDLISRKDALDAISAFENREYRRKSGSIKDAYKLISVLPSAERTGEWMVGDAFPHNVYCSNCFATYAQEKWEVWADGTLPRDYCPNCGARMLNGGK